ncbi:MAG: protein-glutamate O-methyltransferase CheR [Nitrospirae bacterium]|nr:protein-glutamate O-methyltransferase CheR [Nitrospirota bacterium]
MQRPRLSHAGFDYLRDLVYEETGILLGLEKRYLLESRLKERLDQLGLTTLDDYTEWMKTRQESRAEREHLVDLLTTQETSFFRHGAHFQTLREGVFPRLVEGITARERPLRVWSAGCSTGEEAYSLVMTFLETRLPLQGWKIRVFATDVSKRALQRAQAGLYRVSSLKNTQEMYVRKYFTREEDGLLVLPAVREAVTFVNMSLLEVRKVRLLPAMDVVFCRNVVMYFDDKARRTAAEHMADRLRGGGYLFLGHQESIPMQDLPLRPEDHGRALVYRKVQDG